ncbi:MAG: N-6 DNA methylase [Gammaproteobacteria bacterium]|nr:N-6 DNA methylase [Gammaproteobacteria bacterium]
MAQLEHIEAIEKRLWSAADNLRANSNYASNEYFLPVMGLVFLRHAYSRYLMVKEQIEPHLPSRGGKTRALTKEDFSQRSAIYLRPAARFDSLVALPDSADRARAIIEAMESIEADYENLRGTLPKGEYQELDNQVLGQLLRTLNPEELNRVSGDVFGRIYEYFLTQFADQGAHDGGEFFTPISLVSLIAHVLNPARGTVLDPACGSGGMFVQSARIVEEHGDSPTEKLTFRGLEKNATTIRLAKMNLAVHGLEGDIQKAITYYEDPHELVGKADYVMANPPFNVDEIDADKVKSDPRLPFGLPGVNKKEKVSNGNYVWISYFYSYLNDKGRAGFVMSSQASSAGGGEAKVRQKLVETGDVDLMIAIRSNFFYTRTVPCELWFIDRGKPDQPSSPALLPEAEGGKTRQYRGGHDFSGLVERARELRKKQTPAEELFWELVRNRQFLGLKFRRQHQAGDYILDFYCHEAGIAIEIDGPVHDKRKKKDAKSDAYLKSQGIRVVRIENAALLNDTEATLGNLAKQISAIGESPLPLGEDLGEGRFSSPLNRKGHVLMLDARNIYRKVTRKIYDFSPEQQQNLQAIVWLYRGATNRYLQLLSQYLGNVADEAIACFKVEDDLGHTFHPLADFSDALDALRQALAPYLKTPFRKIIRFPTQAEARVRVVYRKL